MRGEKHRFILTPRPSPLTPAASVRIVLITVPRGQTAGLLAQKLVEARHAACVSVIAGLQSHYRWQGKLHKDAETLLLVKTTTARLPALMRFVKTNHPAQVPEILSLPVGEGEAEYLSWLFDSVR